MLQPSRTMADHTLLGWVASGDAAALRELEQRHGRSVYALAYGIVIDPGEADEVVANHPQPGPCGPVVAGVGERSARAGHRLHDVRRTL